MKKLLISLMCVLGTVCVAERVNAWGNSADDYIAIKTGSATYQNIHSTQVNTGATVTPSTSTPSGVGQILVGSTTDAAWIATGTTTADWTPISGPQVATETNVVTTTYTPDYIGQTLVGTYSNLFWGASGLTTNDWNALN